MSQNPTQLHAIGNAHLDPVWLWLWSEGLESIRATFRSALDRMNEYDDFVFTSSSAVFYEMLERANPEMLEEIKQRVSEGRWEIVGGWWDQPDTNMPCGEALIRQAVYGQKTFIRLFGAPVTIGYNPDTFGHPFSLPKILKATGFERYVFMRPMQNEKELPGNVFIWQSQDGSEVMASRIHKTYCTEPDELVEHVQSCQDVSPDYLNTYFVFYGVGNHGGGPTKRNIQSIIDIGNEPDSPNIKLSSLKSYFNAVDIELKNGAKLPIVRDELLHHAQGCYSAHSEIKRQNRRVEHMILSTERLTSIAKMASGWQANAESIEMAWKQLLFNQFHDVLCGSSIPSAYEEARDQMGRAADLAATETAYALQSITQQIDTTGTDQALVVFNSLPWNIKVPVELEPTGKGVKDTDGTLLPIQSIPAEQRAYRNRNVFVADAPAMGYKTYFRTETEQEHAEKRCLNISGTTIENRFWILEIDPETGGVNRLYDKRNGVELFDKPAGRLVVIDDASDTWGHGKVSYRDDLGFFGDPVVELEEEGPVRACLRIKTKWNNSTAITRWFIYDELDIIEIRLSIVWNEQYKMLKLDFPFALDNPKSVAEIPYGYAERAVDGGENPCLQWIDVSGMAKQSSGENILYGTAILNQGKYGYDVLNSNARVTLLRSPVYAWDENTLIKEDESPRFMDIGEHLISFRLAPHAGDWTKADIPRRAWEFNCPPVYVNEYNHKGELPLTASFFRCETPNFLPVVFKRAENGEGFVIRGYETSGESGAANWLFPYSATEKQIPLTPHKIISYHLSEDGKLAEMDNICEL